MTEFKPFTRSDWDAFSGADKFSDGTEPLIGCAHSGVIIVISGAEEGGAVMELTIEQPEGQRPLGWMLNCKSKNYAVALGALLLHFFDESIGF